MKITITFNLDNAAFKHDDGTLDHDQVAIIIWNIQDDISRGDTEGIIKDDSGNTVGKWAITGT